MVYTPALSRPFTLRKKKALGAGPGVLLMDINNFSKHQHEARPLWNCNGPRQKQDHSIVMSEYKKYKNIIQATKYQHLNSFNYRCAPSGFFGGGHSNFIKLMK